jgi:hypothetical protein
VARLAAPRAPQAKSVAVISVSDPDAVQAVMKRLLDAEGLVMLCEAKGPTPLERIPLSRVVEAIGDQVELIVLADDGGGWRDPMSELCRTLAPERYDAKSSYLFFERGELVHGIKRDLFDALSDAEKITDFLAGRVSGVQRFKRQKDY